MRELVLPVLSGAIFVTGVLCVAAGFWMVFGVMQHAKELTPNEVWTVVSRHYRRPMLAFFTLFAASIVLGVFTEWLRRHP